MTESTLNELLANSDYKILKRVPNQLNTLPQTEPKLFLATIIDLETMGMDAHTNEIIEIGILSFFFNNTDGITGIKDSYNELNDPGKPIPTEISKITGITDKDVKGKKIDWDRVHSLIAESHLIICHNSRFDRNFLELQTPVTIKETIEKKPFACTMADIDWRGRGYEGSKLEYLNFKLGFFYEGHRAIIDCWATLNLLVQENGAFDELKDNARRKQTLLCAVNAAYEKKDLLSTRKYRWSDGTKSLPKCWYITLNQDQLDNERVWLDENIYLKQGTAKELPCIDISAFSRYSYRAENIKRT